MAQVQDTHILHALKVAAAYCTIESQLIQRDLEASGELGHALIGERMAKAALAGLEAGWRGEEAPPPLRDAAPEPPPTLKITGIHLAQPIGFIKAIMLLKMKDVMDTLELDDGATLIGFTDFYAVRIYVDGRGRTRYEFGMGDWDEAPAPPRPEVYQSTGFSFIDATSF